MVKIATWPPGLVHIMLSFNLLFTITVIKGIQMDKIVSRMAQNNFQPLDSY